MKLYEYEAKALLSRQGINIPGGAVSQSPDEAGRAALKVGFPAMIKAQILRGKRGKSGLVKEAGSLREAIDLATDLLGSKADNEVIDNLLVEEKIQIKAELFVAITCDDVKGCPVIVCSSRGGVDVEELSNGEQGRMVKYHVDPLRPFHRHNAIGIVKEMGFEGHIMVSLANTLTELYRLYKKTDAGTVEINPLVISQDNSIYAVDAKITLDSAAIERHPDLKQYIHKEPTGDPLEDRAAKSGITFINLGGSIALISGGAGITMTILDMIKHFGGSAANFLDMMGGVGPEVFSEATDIVITKANSDPVVKVIFININLSATPLEGVVRGFSQGFARRTPKVPVVAFIQATDAAVINMSLDEGRRRLEKIGIKMYSELEDAIKAAVSVARG